MADGVGLRIVRIDCPSSRLMLFLAGDGDGWRWRWVEVRPLATALPFEVAYLGLAGSAFTGADLFGRRSGSIPPRLFIKLTPEYVPLAVSYPLSPAISSKTDTNGLSRQTPIKARRVPCGK